MARLEDGLEAIELQRVLTVTNLLQKDGPLSDREERDLQTALKGLDCYGGAIDGKFYGGSCAAVINFLSQYNALAEKHGNRLPQDSTEIIANISPHMTGTLIKYGQGDAFVQLRDNNGVQPVVSEIRGILDQYPNLSAAPPATIGRLQALLTLEGIDPGPIDKIYGEKTQAGADIFNEKYPAYTAFAEEPAAQIAHVPLPPQRPDDELETIEIAAVPEPVPLRTTFNVRHGVFTPTREFADPDGNNGYGINNVDIAQAQARAVGMAPPVVTPAAYDSRPLVIIDLGHGADIDENGTIDLGAVSKNGLSEIDVVDPLAKALADDLYAKGYRVAFTRNPGEELAFAGTHTGTLDYRASYASSIARQLGVQEKNVMTISLHANAAKNQHAYGGRVYVRDTDRNPHSLALANHIEGNFQLAGSKDTQDPSDLNSRVLSGMESQLRGGAHILLETGFLTNEGDEAELRRMAANPERYAAQITEGVDNYFRARHGDRDTRMASAPDSRIPGIDYS